MKNSNKKVIRISLTKVLIVIICMLAFLIIALLMARGIGKKDNFILNNEMLADSQVPVKDTYTLNDYGYYVGSNILEEKYNEHGDLTYCKYFDGSINENNFEYTYDDNNRVTSISYSNRFDLKFSLSIVYDNSNIKEIITTSDYSRDEDGNVTKCTYTYNYLDGFIKVDEVIEEDDVLSDTGTYILYDKELNGKIYRLVDYNDRERTVIYEKDDEEYKNAFQMLGIIPEQYSNILTESSGRNEQALWSFKYYFSIANLNTKRILYDSRNRYEYDTLRGLKYVVQDVNRYIYDEKDRLIQVIKTIGDNYSNDATVEVKMYKYEDTNYGNLVTEFLYCTDSMRIEKNKGVDEAEKMEDGYNAYTQTIKEYKNENGVIFKFDEIDDKKYYSSDEVFDIYEKDYLEYEKNRYIQDEADICNKMMDLYREDVDFPESEDDIYDSNRNKDVVSNNESIDILKDEANNNITTETNNTSNSNGFNANEDLISTEFKLYLSNLEWCQQNLYLKEDYFGNIVDLSIKQKINWCQVSYNLAFAVIEIEDSVTRECFVLNYDDGKISVNSLKNKKTRADYIVDKKKETLVEVYNHGGSCQYIIYSYKDGNVKKVCDLSYSDGSESTGGILEVNEQFTYNDNLIGIGGFYIILNKWLSSDLSVVTNDFAELTYLVDNY